MSKHKKQDEVDGRAARMKRKPYEAEMRRLHGELVAHAGVGEGHRREDLRRL